MEPHSAANFLFYYAQVNRHISSSESAKERLALQGLWGLLQSGLSQKSTLVSLKYTAQSTEKKQLSSRQQASGNLEWWLQIKQTNKKKVWVESLFWPKLQ